MARDVLEIKNKYKNRQKRRKRIARLLSLSIILIILLFIFALYSPWFNIIEIEVEGQKKLTPERIISISGIQKGENVFKINTSQINNKIGLEPYVRSAKVIRKLPNKILISINEREPISMVSYMGSYIFIDKEGIALELVPENERENLIEIAGIACDKFTLGKPIVEKDSGNFKIALNILTLLLKDDLLHRIDYINVKSLDKVIIGVDKKFDVNLGDSKELDTSGLRRRFLFLKEIVKTEKGSQKKYIDMTDEDKPILSTPASEVNAQNPDSREDEQE